MTSYAAHAGLDSQPRPVSVEADLTIVRRLAVGGTAEIVLARRADGQPVVVKRLLPNAGEEMAQRLHREGELLTQIRSPYVVRLVAAGDHALLLEYVEGIDAGALSSRLMKRGEALPLGAAIAVASALGQGLAAVHAAGAVHADVSPGNVLLGRDGAVKLTDLGVARRLGEGGRSAPEGTLAYQPPEQLALGSIEPSADLYAAALIVYELATGVPARPAGQLGLAELMAARGQRPAPPSEVRPGLPKQLDDLLLAVLDPDPARRPPLSFWLDGLSAISPPDPITLRATVGNAVGAPIPSAKTAAPLPAKRTALLDTSAIGDGMSPDSGPVTMPSHAFDPTVPSPLPSATQLGQPAGIAGTDLLSANTVPTPAVTTQPVPLPDEDEPSIEITAPGRSWSSAAREPADEETNLVTAPSAQEETRTFVDPRGSSDDAGARTRIIDDGDDDDMSTLAPADDVTAPSRSMPGSPSLPTPTPTPTGARKSRSVELALVVAFVAAALAIVAYMQTRPGPTSPAPAAVVPTEPTGPSGEVPVVIARKSTEPVDPAPPPLDRPPPPPPSVKKKPAKRRVARTPKGPRLEVRAAGSGAVRVRGAGMNGRAPKTSGVLAEGGTVVMLTSGDISIPLRVERTGDAVKVDVNAPRGTYYEAQCGNRPKRSTPVRDVAIRGRVTCRVKSPDGGETAFVLRVL